ncbi:beta-lactamase/transpeptidase-like protein [Mycena rosella]|uniref:Beta-lactamase/transpeptidase-like protein n=1 Tax=Mycena rosella TaxID=1033263 RepID=A0AAD7G3J6_MYCRO|nr:beta-lactamase/transpeptidase-like protein [Mycena rosella]
MHFSSLAISLLVCGISVSAADNAPILSPSIDTFVNNLLAEWNSPGGAAVAVSVETKGYGVAKADGTKVTPDTIFSIGSNSKLFDVLATGLLITNDTLSPPISWKTTIASVIPSWKLMDPVASSQSTIADLMSHRTGMPAHDFAYFTFNDTILALASFTLLSVNRLQYLKPSTGFREAYQYNNIMYAIISYLPTALLPHKPSFANATGRMVQGFGREGVNTTANPLGAGTPRALPYFVPTPSKSEDTFSGPGGILSTAGDLIHGFFNNRTHTQARWLQMLLSDGQHPITNARIIPPSVIQMAASPITVVDGNESNGPTEGMMWLSIMEPPRKFNSVLRTSGFFAWVTRLPLDGVGVAVLTNDDMGQFTSGIIKYRILDEILGMDPVDWNSRYKEELQQAAAVTTTPAPSNASLPFPIAAGEGKYRNLGYGSDMALCAPATPSPSCTALLSRLNSTFPAELGSATFVWEWDRPIATYATLIHFEGALFNVSAWIAMPTGNTSDTFWAYTWGLGLETAVAEFSVVEGKVAGFGIRGGFWVAGPSVDEPQGTTVEERSEVWFDALGS